MMIDLILMMLGSIYVGHCMKFLPNKLDDLKKILEDLLEETDETQLKAVLKELLRQNGISLERYEAIKDAYGYL